MAKILSSGVDTVADSIRQHFDSLTRAERQLANTILENYPVSGLGSITQVAENLAVSSPTVLRMVKKLGFKGFPEFKIELRRELETKIAGPIAKHDTWAQRAPDSHILNRFAEAVIDNIRNSLGQIETKTFDASCKLLANTRHHLHHQCYGEMRLIEMPGVRSPRLEYIDRQCAQRVDRAVSLKANAEHKPHYSLND